MIDGKGKDHKPIHDEGESTRPLDQSQSSLLSRVAASATGLTRSALATPGSNELTERAAAALANAGKGQSSSASGSSAFVESSRSSLQPTEQASGSNAFRNGQREEHVRQSESEFSSFLDGIDSFSPSENIGDDECTRGGTADEVGHPETTSWDGRALQSTHGSIAEQENRDGEEVLAILSSLGAMNDPLEIPEADEEEFDWGLSQEQIHLLQAIIKDIFPPPEPHANISPGNPLNLVPSFDTSNVNATHVDSNRSGSHSYIEANHYQRTAEAMWREQWEDVLTRYTDEVWGDLLPIVKEARREVEEMRDEQSGTEPPEALRRLGAILGHLQRR